MRNLKNLSVVLLALLLTACPSCSGLTARQEALLPAIRLAWPGVNADLDVGISTGLQSSRLTPMQGDQLRAAQAMLDGGIKQGNATMIEGAGWTSRLKPEVDAGIAERVQLGEIGSGVAESLRERARNFDEALAKFLERR